MKKGIYILLGLLISISAYGQKKLPKHYSVKGLTCKTCHTCDVPTKNNPCLVGCPRDEMITIHQSAEDAPDVITISTLEDKYVPVVFSHKIHSQMSQMSGGCASCHHFNNVGPIQKCESCHESNRKREDISKPDLKGAFHRQCMDCHKAWSHKTDCTSCHELKSTLAKTQQKNPPLSLSIKNHPEVPEPVKIVYETDYNKGKLVTFFHDEHTEKFNIKCTSCHTDESCNRCHDLQKLSVVEKTALGQFIKTKKSAGEHHKPCFSCHQNDKCSKCHMDKPMDRFNHAIATGWPLNRFHQKLECSKCHGNKSAYTKLNNDCMSCHKNFVSGEFNHKVTGLQLDEIHMEAGCTDCHQTKNFSKPVCTNCHEDKSFPKDKPGEMVKM